MPAYCYKGSADVKTWAKGWNTTTHNDTTCDFAATSYRLPTEAEWEYAARGGPRQQDQSAAYAGSSKPDEVAWYGRMGGDGTKAVATKKPNTLGLYDMNGNVWQWCQDWYQSDIAGTSESRATPATGSFLPRSSKGSGRPGLG